MPLPIQLQCLSCNAYASAPAPAPYVCTTLLLPSPLLRPGPGSLESLQAPDEHTDGLDDSVDISGGGKGSGGSGGDE